MDDTLIARAQDALDRIGLGSTADAGGHLVARLEALAHRAVDAAETELARIRAEAVTLATVLGLHAERDAAETPASSPETPASSPETPASSPETPASAGSSAPIGAESADHVG